MQRRSRTAGISGTLIIHLALLLSFITIPSIKTPPPPPPASKERSVDVVLLPPQEHKSIIPPISDNSDMVSQIDPKICSGQDKSYVGVGFIYSPFTALVINVPEFYPAYQAGIRLGDMILDPSTPIVNGYLDIEVMRGYTQMHFHIKAKKICFKSG